GRTPPPSRGSARYAPPPTDIRSPHCAPPTEVAQPLHKDNDPLAPCTGCGWSKEADGQRLRPLLRLRHERPRSRAANQPNDPAPFQVANGVAPSTSPPACRVAERHSQRHSPNT